MRPSKCSNESMASSHAAHLQKTELVLNYDRLFLAMALHRLNRVEEARELLQAVIDQVEMNRPDKANASTTQRLDSWEQRELSLFRSEAEKLIKPR